MRKSYRPLALLILVLGVSLPVATQAELMAIAFFSTPKQVEKKKTRWTLGDWLTQKEKMRVQDLWLAQNSPSPWEAILGGDVRRNSENTDEKDHRLNFSIHRKRIGFGAEQETHPHRWNAHFFFRFFGYHQQATMITLHGGRQFPDLGSEAWFYGVLSNFYLLEFLGAEGNYRRVFSDAGPWNQTELNAFLELGFLRFYVGRIIQPADSGNSNGYHAGARLYF